MDEYRMIDGKDFADFVSGFASFIKKVSWYTITSIREYIKTAILVFIFTSGTGLFCLYHSKKFYEAEMVCSFGGVNKKTYGEMIHNLDMLVKSRSYNTLAKQLNIPELDAQQVISIEGKNSAGSMLYEDITTDNLPMYFDVRAANSMVFPILETALLKYLNSHSQDMNAKALADSTDISMRIQYIDKNISIVDSVTTTMYTILKKSQSIADTSISASKFATLLTYKRDLEADLVNQKRKAKEISRPIEILHGFVPPDQPSSNKDEILRLTIAVSVISSCSVAVLRKALHDGSNLRSV